MAPRAIVCPRCGSANLRAVGDDWLECDGEVPISGAPPGLTGLPHPILTYGRCGHRWRQGAREAAERETARRARTAADARAEAEAVEESERLATVDLLSSTASPAAALQALRSFDDALPTETLKDLWLRLLQTGSLRPSGDLLLLEGRQTVPGYFLSRGTLTTQWGRWKELSRQPVYLAAGAGHKVTPARGEEWEKTYEGFDVWLDTEGALWSDGRSPIGRGARLAIGNGGHRSRQDLVVDIGASPSLRRRKARWMGWEIIVPNARGAYPGEPGDLAYTRAVRAALEGQVSAPPDRP